MTEMPSFAVLCCGKNVDELSRSVKCCGRASEIMKSAGFILSGYHTLMAANESNAKKLCAEKLFHLARGCDVLLTIGCDGFDSNDILPDVTKKLCTRDEVFFTNNLCGLCCIGNYDKGKRGQSFAPSRSRAGILDKCLVMNIRNDEAFISKILPTLMPSISFAVSALTEKDVAKCLVILQSLADSCETNMN